MKTFYVLNLDTQLAQQGLSVGGRYRHALVLR